MMFSLDIRVSTDYMKNDTKLFLLSSLTIYTMRVAGGEGHLFDTILISHQLSYHNSSGVSINLIPSICETEKTPEIHERAATMSRH